jgi:type IV secretory pathway TraG/TraD family ATPase VirD4
MQVLSASYWEALAHWLAGEWRLFLRRIKATGSILKGLGIAILSAAALGLILYVACCFPYEYVTDDQPWWLIWASVALIIGGCLFGLGYGYNIAVLAAPDLFRRKFTDAPGTARWATLEDLQKAKVVGEHVYPCHDLYCGMFDISPRESVPVYENSDRHNATLGSTRRGKGNGLLVQALDQINESFVVLDPAGELAAMTYEARAKKGLVLVINPFGVLADPLIPDKYRPHLKSCGFNPYLGFRAGEPNFFSRSVGIHDPIIPRGSIADSHWDEGSVQLTTVLGMWDKWREKEGEIPHASMRNVLEMLHYRYAGKGLDSLRGVMIAINKHRDRQMAKLATRFISEDPDDKEIKGVCSTTAGKVRNMNDETLLADMDKHPMIDGKPFDFGMLKDRIITVYIILPDDVLRTYALWLRLLVSVAINALKRSLPGDVLVNLMLDEIGNLGYMEPLDTAMGMIAKKGVKVWTVWQSLSQISRTYGEHGRETFLSGVGMLNSFKADDLETARYLAELLGPRTEIVTSHNTVAQTGDGSKRSDSKTDHAQGFPLMNPTQIMNMGPREMLCWIDQVPHPIKLKAPVYTDLPWIKGVRPSPYYIAKRKR